MARSWYQKDQEITNTIVISWYQLSSPDGNKENLVGLFYFLFLCALGVYATWDPLYIVQCTSS